MNLFAPGFSFYNNTFYRCVMNGGYVVNWGTTQAASGNAARGVAFCNNIMFECGYSNRTDTGWYTATLVSNQVCDYNLVCGIGSGKIKNSDLWRGDGREVHGINGTDPLFYNPDALDFRLKPDSVARGAAVILNELFSTDYVGHLRGNWDMGALQCSGIEETNVTQPAPPRNVKVN
jgi:hypothetical protein